MTYKLLMDFENQILKIKKLSLYMYIFMIQIRLFKQYYVI